MNPQTSEISHVFFSVSFKKIGINKTITTINNKNYFKNE